MSAYSDKLSVPTHLTMGDVGSVIEKLREYGEAELTALDTITFRMEADDDWDLRGLLCEVEDELGALDFEINIDKTKVEGRV